MGYLLGLLGFNLSGRLLNLENVPRPYPRDLWRSGDANRTK